MTASRTEETNLTPGESFTAGQVSRPTTTTPNVKKSGGKRAKKLMDCPVCEWSISKHAHFCPNCGEPDPSNHLMRANWASRIFWLIVIVAAVYYGYTVLFPMVMDMIKNL